LDLNSNFAICSQSVLREARAERVEELKTSQGIRRLKKLCKVESGEQKGIQFFCAFSLGKKKIST
jgi:hypothetical protein